MESIRFHAFQGRNQGNFLDVFKPEAIMAKGIFNLMQGWKGRARKNSERGATAVEMALIIPIFITIMVGCMELSLMEAAQQLLENAAYNTSRLAKTGFTNNGQTQAQTVSQILTQELQ